MIFVVIQSIFGAGLLIFGVPVLLLYGLDYLDIVGMLLPSSIAISMLQLFKHRNIKSTELKLLPLAILGITIGLSLSIFNGNSNVISRIIGLSMLFASLLRSNSAVKKYTASVLMKHRSIFHFANSIFHGFSNLGGILLTFYSASVYKDKINSMCCTALYYLVYAASQTIILICIGKAVIFQSGLPFLPLTLALYLVVGQKTFGFISQHQFDNLATAFFFFAGAVFLCS